MFVHIDEDGMHVRTYAYSSSNIYVHTYSTYVLSRRLSRRSRLNVTPVTHIVTPHYCIAQSPQTSTYSIYYEPYVQYYERYEHRLGEVELSWNRPNLARVPKKCQHSLNAEAEMQPIKIPRPLSQSIQH